jgi:hypothetical protein
VKITCIDGNPIRCYTQCSYCGGMFRTYVPPAQVDDNVLIFCDTYCAEHWYGLPITIREREDRERERALAQREQELIAQLRTDLTFRAFQRAVGRAA